MVADRVSPPGRVRCAERRDAQLDGRRGDCARAPGSAVTPPGSPRPSPLKLHGAGCRRGRGVPASGARPHHRAGRQAGGLAGVAQPFATVKDALLGAREGVMAGGACRSVRPARGPGWASLVPYDVPRLLPSPCRRGLSTSLGGGRCPHLELEARRPRRDRGMAACVALGAPEKPVPGGLYADSRQPPDAGLHLPS
jgi:hypothetical protein